MDKLAKCKAIVLEQTTSCENGECTKNSHKVCTEEKSPHYGGRTYRKCEHYSADTPEKNKKITKGQSCINCRFERYGCNCWKNWSPNKVCRGIACRNWQKEIEGYGYR